MAGGGGEDVLGQLRQDVMAATMKGHSLWSLTRPFHCLFTSAHFSKLSVSSRKKIFSASSRGRACKGVEGDGLSDPNAGPRQFHVGTDA
jgi:hypothetical protein